MANGKKVQPWFPANDTEAVKADAGKPYQGVDGNFYVHEDMASASAKNPPAPAAPEAASPSPDDPESHATPPAVSESGPSADDHEDAAAAEAEKLADSAPPSVENSTSHRKPIPGGPTDPSYDADKFDSTGKGEKQDGQLGPRGVNKPLDAMSEEERAELPTKQEERLRKGMSPTHSIDSVGKPKGVFAVKPQGLDKHGARIPDAIDYEHPIEPHVPMVGPRGKGAPKDTFHKK